MNLKNRITKLEKIGESKKPTPKEIKEAAMRSFTYNEPFPYTEEDFPDEDMTEEEEEWIKFLLGGGTVKEMVKQSIDDLLNRT